MNACAKCGSSEIKIEFVPSGKLIDSSSLKNEKSEFIKSSEYDYYYQLTAAKDHLKKRCLSCGHVLRARTLDDKTTGDK